MNAEKMIVVFSIVTGLFVCAIDGCLDYFIFYEGTFWGLMISDVPPHEIYVRTVNLLAFIAFGVTVSRFVSKRKRTEEELTGSNERFRTVMDSLDAVVYVADPDSHKVLFVNQHGRDIWGDVVGKTCWRVLQSGQTGPCRFCTNDKLVDGSGEPTGVWKWEFQNTVDRQWYECRDRAIRWTDGRLVRMEIATNITERKQAEDQLRESEARYRSLVEDQTEFIVRWKPDGTRTFVNDAYCRYFGQPREQLVGTSFFPLIVEEHREMVWRRIKSLTPDDPASTDEHQAIRPDGTSAWQQWTDRAIFDDDGRLIEMQSVGRDVTERKLAEQALREEKERAQNYLDIAGVILVAIDAGQRVTLINRKGCEVLGRRENEIIGKNWFDVAIPARERETVKRTFAMIVAGDITPVEYFENLVITKRGEERLVAWHNAILRDSEGRIVGTLSSGEDITERRRMERATKKLVEIASAKFGRAFFESMAVQLADALDADYVLIGELQEGEKESIRTISVVVDGELADRFDYDLAGTPCENVVGKAVCSYASSVADLFPEDLLLRQMSVEGYVGVPLFDSLGSALGVIVALYRHPLTETEFAESILQIFAARTGSEIERLRAEEALRRSEEQTRLLLESTAEAVYGLDLDGNCTFCNPACLQLLGYGRGDQLLGQCMHDLIHHTRPDGSVYPIDECRIYEAFQRGEGTHVTDEVLWRADGTCFPAEYSSHPIRHDGEIIGSVVTFVDVTERMRADEMLRENEAKFRGLAERSFDMIFTTDLQGRITYVSSAAERMFLVKPEEAVGRHFREFLVESEVPRAMRDFGIRAEGSDVGVARYEAKRSDGSHLSIELNSSPVFEGGKPVAVQGIIRDVSERNEAERKLRLMESELAHVGRVSTMGEMAAGVTHEVSQPLCSILTYAQASNNILEAEAETDLESVRKWNAAITKAATRAGEIVRRLREFARRSEPQRSLCSINEIVNESVQLVAAEMRRHETAVRLELAEVLPDVEVDRVQIQQVLVNLLQNAGEAMNEVVGQLRAVTIRTELADEFVKLSVADNGPGLPPNCESKVFDPFVTTKEDGLGMGLAITQTIVEAHGGTAQATSNPDGGTTFQFTLPIVREGETDDE